MSTNADRLEMDFQDPATTSTTPPVEAPADLADSPTVKEGDAAVSPATAARAAIPGLPGPGMTQDRLHNPLPPAGADPAAIMTERTPGVDPGSPLGPGVGTMHGDNPAGKLPGDTPDAANVGLDPARGALTDVADNSGTLAGADETTGTDDTIARTGRG